MSQGKIFQPQRRLAKLMKEPGGISIATALSMADKRVEGARGKTLDVINANIDGLAATVTQRSEAKLMEAYSLCTEITALAGTYSLNELSFAAESLTGLLAAWRERRPLEKDSPLEPYSALFWDAACVHADALRTLQRPEFANDMRSRKAMVDGLRRVAQRAMPAQPAPKPEAETPVAANA